MKNERERIATLRCIWAAVVVLLLAVSLTLWLSDILEYFAPPDEDVLAADDYWMGCIFLAYMLLPILDFVGLAGFLSVCMIRRGVYLYEENEICVYVGACTRFVKVNGEIVAKGNFRVKTVALENGEEITVHILDINRIAVQTANGYLHSEKER